MFAAHNVKNKFHKSMNTVKQKILNDSLIFHNVLYLVVFNTVCCVTLVIINKKVLQYCLFLNVYYNEIVYW